MWFAAPLFSHAVTERGKVISEVGTHVLFVIKQPVVPVVQIHNLS